MIEGSMKKKKLLKAEEGVSRVFSFVSLCLAVQLCTILLTVPFHGAGIAKRNKAAWYRNTY